MSADADPWLHRPGTASYARFNLAMAMAGLAAFGLLYAPQPLLPSIASAYSVTAGHAALTASGGTGALALAVLPITRLAER